MTRYNMARTGDTPCQSNGAHHPHRLVCAGDDCDPDQPGGQCSASSLDCCICGEEWPCSTKRQHIADRRTGA